MAESEVQVEQPVRWMYPVVGGVIAEALTIALMALIVAMTGHGGAGPGGEAIDPVAQRIGAVVSAAAGSLACFLAGWWAARRAGGRFETHGLLTGAAAGFLTAFGAVFGPPGQSAYYLVAVALKLVAGRAGGRSARRMAAAASS